MTMSVTDNEAWSAALPVTVCIPTYRREEVLVETVKEFLTTCCPVPGEIVVVDQTPCHRDEVSGQLGAWHHQGRIRWIRRAVASQPGALNEGLLAARQPLVLFVDDDIRIVPELLARHVNVFENKAVWASVGQILQPGQQESAALPACESGPFADLEFPFHSRLARQVTNVMSGNLMVRREHALSVGGFDENYTPPVSYRFDSDFAKRVVKAGGQIEFVPGARIYHLRTPTGGTRSNSSHLTSASPEHGVGDYYFALRHAKGVVRWRHILQRPVREISTRFHLRHPWYIPVKLTGEVRALVAAWRLHRRNPGLLRRQGVP